MLYLYACSLQARYFQLVLWRNSPFSQIKADTGESCPSYSTTSWQVKEGESISELELRIWRAPKTSSSIFYVPHRAWFPVSSPSHPEKLSCHLAAEFLDNYEHRETDCTEKYNQSHWRAVPSGMEHPHYSDDRGVHFGSSEHSEGTSAVTDWYA